MTTPAFKSVTPALGIACGRLFNTGPTPRAPGRGSLSRAHDLGLPPVVPLAVEIHEAAARLAREIRAAHDELALQLEAARQTHAAARGKNMTTLRQAVDFEAHVDVAQLVRVVEVPTVASIREIDLQPERPLYE